MIESNLIVFLPIHPTLPVCGRGERRGRLTHRSSRNLAWRIKCDFELTYTKVIRPTKFWNFIREIFAIRLIIIRPRKNRMGTITKKVVNLFRVSDKSRSGLKEPYVWYTSCVSALQTRGRVNAARKHVGRILHYDVRTMFICSSSGGFERKNCWL